MKEGLHLPGMTAEQVHYVVNKTSKLSVGVTAGGAIVGNLPISVGGTIAWAVSRAVDMMAVRRINNRSEAASSVGNT